jgi:hypothetical protein
MEVVTMLGIVLKNQKDQPPEVHAKGETLIESVKKARYDSDPNIRAWAGFLFTFAGPELERLPNLQRMIGDESWQSRLMGLAAMANVPRDRQKQFAEEILEKESQQFVKDFAKATLEKAPPKPTTQPAEGAAPAQN